MPGHSWTYSYDAGGRRVTRVADGVTHFAAHAGGMEIADYLVTAIGASGGDPVWTFQITQRYIPGAGVDQRVAMINTNSSGTATARYYYHVNRLGSVIALVNDANGLVTDQYVYTPFGVETPLATSGNPFRYTGRRYDAESGLYYYRARYYWPQIGRFLETDPIGYADQMNLYAYVGNSPLMGTDPTGESGVTLNLNLDVYLGVGFSLDGGIYLGTNESGQFEAGFVGSAAAGFGIDLSVGVEGATSGWDSVEAFGGSYTELEVGIGAIAGSVSVTGPTSVNDMLDSYAVTGGGGVEAGPLPVSGHVAWGQAGRSCVIGCGNRTAQPGLTNNGERGASGGSFSTPDAIASTEERPADERAAPVMQLRSQSFSAFGSATRIQRPE